MTNNEKKKFIKDLLEGPLRRYLQGETSFGNFKDEINQEFGLNFKYSELYPSYLFNAELYYPTVDDFLAKDVNKDIYIDARIKRDPNYAKVIKEKAKRIEKDEKSGI